MRTGDTKPTVYARWIPANEEKRKLPHYLLQELFQARVSVANQSDMPPLLSKLI